MEKYIIAVLLLTSLLILPVIIATPYNPEKYLKEKKDCLKRHSNCVKDCAGMQKREEMSQCVVECNGKKEECEKKIV